MSNKISAHAILGAFSAERPVRLACVSPPVELFRAPFVQGLSMESVNSKNRGNETFYQIYSFQTLTMPLRASISSSTSSYPHQCALAHCCSCCRSSQGFTSSGSRITMPEVEPLPPIAIVGMAVELPGAQDSHQLWDLLVNGLNTVSEVFRVQTSHEDLYSLLSCRSRRIGSTCAAPLPRRPRPGNQ